MPVRLLCRITALLFAFSIVTTAITPPLEGQFADDRAEITAILDYHYRVTRLDGRQYGLPEHDFDDGTNITLRQRRFFRAQYPDTPVNGIYQYPRWAYAYLHAVLPAGQRALMSMATVDTSLSGTGSASAWLSPGAWPAAVTVGANVDVSNNSQVESETYMAIDPTNPRYLVGSSNNITGNPQMMFYSGDWGATWNTVLLPMVCTFHSDPVAAFDSAGNAYSSTLEYSTGCGNSTRVNVYQSTDHGATWSAGVTVSSTKNNDKELMAVDHQTASPCKDRLYVAWDDGGSEKVATAATYTGPWTVYGTTLDTGSIGTDIAIGPGGEIYDVWANFNTSQIYVSKSSNCGTSWSAKRSIAATADGYDYGVIAECSRRALIYPSVDVDRSNSVYRGRVYAAWNDFTAVQSNGCVAVADTNTANIYFSSSADGGATWTPKKIVHQDIARTDQFNQWMRVDDLDGCIHISWQDTRNDVNRAKTDVYYTRSCDGGASFDPEIKVSSAQSDETVAGADSGNQYGDYAGLAVRGGVIYPFWTDRRAGWGGDEETATVRLCSDPKTLGTVTAADANACTSGAINIGWTLPSIYWGDNGAGARKFQLFRDGILVQDNLAQGTTTLSYNPGDALSHSYAIKAVNGCGNVAAYTAALATDGVDAVAPGNLGNTLLAGKSGGNIALSWTASGAADLNHYNYYGAAAAASYPTGWTLLGTTAGAGANDPLVSANVFYLASAVDNCGNVSQVE